MVHEGDGMAAEIQLAQDHVLETITTELRAAIAEMNQAAEDTVRAAIRVGELLGVIRSELVPHGEWHAWLEANTDITPKSAAICIRIATYQDHVLGKASTPWEADKMIRGLPALYEGTPWRKYPSWMPDEARVLRKQGMKLSEIATELGASEHAVWSWIDPNHNARKRREQRDRREARLALKRERKRQAARRLGTALGESYSHVRLLAEALDAAIAETDDETIKRSLRAARSDLIDMEAHIEQVLRLA
jgi:predicted transcriptional regulator